MKSLGLGDNLYCGGYDLSGDVGVINKIDCPRTTINITAINASAFERLVGTRDGGIDFTAFMNGAVAHSHPVLSALPTTDIGVMYCRGTALGAASAAIVAKQVNYDGTRSGAGDLTFKVSAVANSFGLDWGTLLTPGIQSDVAATNGPAVDSTLVGGTAFGWQAYLQSFALTGTSCTVTIEESATGVGAWTPLANAAFAAFTTRGTQRLQAVSGTATVKQYVRAVTTGTFTLAGYAIMFARNTGTVADF